ncbi:polysaccharide biosynthesis tyrosine autokinase [Dyadobacter chenwenxiniae]|uniref:Polysaccharide biosynthesis tyrosine autokinase n=1 Tax=Dyadobacter chenwenxiniae TaxID=2906456 RepID=A0A9X1THB4_9BACT|nr:polysaccharide biosynthesis tyrosine autokinase [Dyadobacter chenwenxiniae]MCF0064314.1 polysaccharide biosynthesis tyrosine autokinase [Dyadobacter chenwenxiniae]UON82475.1 polysaccharide biosynthesis tyrosine autokinase [Dyadobacter chenwenxiniae]
MQVNRLDIDTNSNSDNLRNAMLLLHSARNHWRWIAFSLVLSLAIAFIYLRYITPQYLITASILVRDDAKGSEFGDTAFLESMGLSSVKSSVDNEVEILKSRTLMESVVEDLQLNVRYFSTGRLKTTELYDKSPFKLTLIHPTNSRNAKSATYFLTIGKKNHFELHYTAQTYKGTFGTAITIPDGQVTLERTSNIFNPDDQYAIEIQDQEQLVDQYRKALTVSPTNKLVSTVNLSLNEMLPKKGEAILERLLINYFKTSIEEKNRIADSTLAFINKNLHEVSIELADSERAIEIFQTSHHITDFSEDIRQLLTQSGDYQREENKYNVQSQIVNALLHFLRTNPKHIVPAQLFVQDPGFLPLIEKYNELQLAVTKGLITINKSHPDIRSQHAQLDHLRKDLIANIISQHNDLQVGLTSIANYKAKVSRKLDQIPATERKLLEVKRQQQIKQELYILLLKKRVETSISKSSTLANARIIDKPKSGANPVKPNRQLVILMSGFIGIAFPLAVVHLKNILNTRITDISDITTQLNLNVLAEISHEHGPEKSILFNAQSQVAEQFRVLRTNIQFLGIAKQNQVILLTSSMSGEGKSFIAVNLCGSLALTGKSVLLLELDLRRPRMAKELALQEEGFTNWLSSDRDLQAFTQKALSNNTFDVITAGHIPPNPSELLALPKVNEVIQTLKVKYDFIILDTPPIGLVTDARLLSHIANLSLYIVRQGLTYKNQLGIIREIQNQNQLRGLHLILNDIRETPGYNYGYGYYASKKPYFFTDLKRNLFKS